MLIVIFSYSRPHMLLRLLKELEGEDMMVFDDCSTYDPSEHRAYCTYFRSTFNGGKVDYWKQWRWAFDVIEETNYDEFLFLPDDWHAIGLDSIKYVNEYFTGQEFAFNVVNRGREACWTPIKKKRDDIGKLEAYKVGFVDCAFSTNRTTLEQLDFNIDPVPIGRFNSERISSGVGQQLTKRLWWKKVPMYKPVKSLAWTDQKHKSLMNPTERQIHPNVPI